MPDVMVVGSYNAGLTVYTDRLPTSGQTVVGSDLNDGPGGKGANQAIGIHRLGVDVGLVVKIGKDAFGERARQMLAGEGLPAAGILTGDRPTGMAMIIVDGAGDNLIVVAPGANGELGWGEVMHRFRAELNQCRWIVLQLECPTGLAVAAARWARANGKRTVLDPAPCRGLTADTVGLFDILTPNESELAELGTLVGLSGRSVVEQATGLVDLGVPDVVATLGENGVLWASERGWSELGGYKVEAVDTTGAGDAYAAGFLTALTQGRELA
ncbi:MAG: ribokinase, partial [Acidimicrobiales bacterium]